MRTHFNISLEVAVWWKIRQVFTKLVRGHWNDRRFRTTLPRLLVDMTTRVEGSLLDMKRQLESDPDFRVYIGRAVDLLNHKPTLNEVRETIREWLPPDIPVTRKNLRELLGKNFDLPENPDLDRFLKSVDATLPTIDKERLRHLARKSYEAKNGRGSSRKLNTTELDEICVNHLRHQYSPYDEELDRFLGKQPVDVQSRFHAALKMKILDAIAEADSWLERECLRQKAELPS
jgi:hypothetical protein